jgi:hypothetical protein
MGSLAYGPTYILRPESLRGGRIGAQAFHVLASYLL